jgi:hypothetical protein
MPENGEQLVYHRRIFPQPYRLGVAMYCPRCGSIQSDELKFCKACGANLYAVRKVVDFRATDEKFDRSNSRVAKMLMSGEEAAKSQVNMDRDKGVTAATTRYEEIKDGILTSSVGLGIVAFLHILMAGIIRSGAVGPTVAEVLSHVWAVGLIPLFIGIALILNGYFVSRKIVELTSRDELPELDGREAEPHSLRPAETTEFVPSSFSVTEGTTKHLKSSN